MRRVENRDYGKTIDHDPQWKGPLEIERVPTDVRFLYALGVYFALWISVGIYAFCTGDVESMSYDVELYISSDVSTIVYIVVGFTILGTCLNFLYLVLLRYFTKTMVFSSIFIPVVLIFAIIAGVMVWVVGKIEADPDDIQIIQSIVIVFFVSILLVIVIGWILFLVAFYKKVLIACGVIKESTKVVMFFPSSFLFPILQFTLSAMILAFFTCTALFLYENPPMKTENTHIYLDLLHGINIFGFYWMYAFINAFSEMVLSGTFATWYWTMDKNQIPSLIITRFLRIATRFHLGTLAFGSLILAIIRGLRALFEWLGRRSAQSRDYFSAALFCCLNFMCRITDNLLEYLNSNAYILCTMHGTRFIQSAKDAFNLLMRNLMSAVVTDSIAEFILFFGGFLVVGFSVLATYAYCLNMENREKYSAMILVFIVTAMVSFAILDILRTAIMTMFLCVLEDYERNNGSRERPYFMSDELKQLIIRDQVRS